VNAVTGKGSQSQGRQNRKTTPLSPPFFGPLALYLPFLFGVGNKEKPSILFPPFVVVVVVGAVAVALWKITTETMK